MEKTPLGFPILGCVWIAPNSLRVRIKFHYLSLRFRVWVAAPIPPRYIFAMNFGRGESLSIVVIGASGDLARRKVLPALFSLYSQDFLPWRFHILGFARSPLSTPLFRERIAEHLTCRYVPEHDCERKQREFLNQCAYLQGRYESPQAFAELHRALKHLEQNRPANRLFYFAIPPSVFIPTARAMAQAGLANSTAEGTWSHVIVEKPFGHDRFSFEQMNEELVRAFSEENIYRIDHYLGKEIIQNFLALRFANIVFEPIWNREYVRQVQITWKEDTGIGDRAGYFDGYGIIRDIVQNHLMQMLALLAMERPASLTADAIRDAKTAAVRAIPPLKLDDLVIGQYTAVPRASSRIGLSQPGYREERGVPPDSITPTYAAMELRLENDRWRGVPFLVRVGKGLDRKINEIRLCFRAPAHNLFEPLRKNLPGDCLVIRVQPDESIILRIINKVPGFTFELSEQKLDLRYATAFKTVIPEAYESLLLDAIKGDKSLFLRSDELAAAWDVFTPALHELERRRIEPLPYPFGSEGPPEADRLPQRYGEKWR